MSAGTHAAVHLRPGVVRPAPAGDAGGRLLGAATRPAVTGRPAPRRAVTRRRTGVTVVAVLALAGALVLTDVVLGPGRSAGTVPAETVAEALAAAGAAQEAHRDLNGGYTTDHGALVHSGWVLVPGVEVSVLSADRESFCLAAGPAGTGPTAWLTEAWTPLAEPCG